MSGVSVDTLDPRAMLDGFSTRDEARDVAIAELNRLSIATEYDVESIVDDITVKLHSGEVFFHDVLTFWEIANWYALEGDL